MNRGNMRELLRRRLDEPSTTDLPNDGGIFTDAQLDEALNVGAGKLKRRIAVMDPEAFIKISRQNLEANSDLYPKPVGSGPLYDLRMLDSNTGTYKTLGDACTKDELDSVASTGNAVATRFGFFGRFIRLAPAPQAAVTDGLEWWFDGAVSIETGTSHDDETFPFPIELSNLVVLLTQQFLLPEQVGDDAKALGDLIAEEAADLPAYYRRTLGVEIGFSTREVKRGSGSNTWTPGNGVPMGSNW